MRLYAGTSEQFIRDTVQNQIAEKLRQAFFSYFRYYPSENEVRSWRNSLRAIKDVFQLANLIDHGVILEYQLPLTSKRLDCLICGKNNLAKENAVIIELKQWEKCEDAVGENEVLTWVGGGKREQLHPSVQVGQYKIYLQDTHTAFNEGTSPVSLSACAYLHNYNYDSKDTIFAGKFHEALENYPLFTADDVEKLKDYLINRLDIGQGIEVLKRIEESKYRPSKKLMDHVGQIVRSKLTGKEVKLLGGFRGDYVLLDEQLVIYDKVFATVTKGFHNKQKQIIVVKGGPGTGKSVIALKLLADLNEKHYNAQYSTGSVSFTSTLRKIVGTKASAQFKYFLSYAEADLNEIDVLICDEAHRIREKTVRRYGKPSGLKQTEELIKAAKVVVFLIDEDQIVRPGEIGSSGLIKEIGAAYGCEISEYELEAQFRCNGSDAFVNWINNTLGIKRTANVIWDLHDEFDFKIFDTPFDLETAIHEKVKEGYSGRVTAGFCWPWSYPNEDGTLKDDVVIGKYARPWDAKHDAKKLAPGIPKAQFWAYDPNGINQIGCVYTAQGFEFDYIGVIFGKDLVYNFDQQGWEGNKKNSADSSVKKSKDEEFLKYVKNIYRVLLSRGVKGCYVHFMDKDTERYFKSRMEMPIIKERPEESKLIYLVKKDIEDEDKYKEYLPIYSLKVAASGFINNEAIHEEGWMKVNIGRKLNDKMFIAKVVGHSMEPLISDNSYCVFKTDVAGSRQGKVVLAQHQEIHDNETGGSFTVKKYQSEKKVEQDGSWHHEKITLEPINKDYEPIVITVALEGEFKVIAEFVAVV